MRPPPNFLVKRPVLLRMVLGCALAHVCRGEAGPQSSLPLSGSTEKVWRQRQPLAGGSVFAATVAGPDERLYVITGSIGDTGQLTSRNGAYDPLRDAWTTLAPIPTARSEPGAALGSGGQIYVVGGNPTLDRKHSSTMNIVEVYDTATDRSTRRKPMLTPRTALCAVAATDSVGHVLVYAIGGRNFDLPGNGLSNVEAYEFS